MFDQLVKDVAIGLARKHRLVVDGVLWCWNCGHKPALMPSLHCPHCLAESWRRRGIVGQCVQREQTPQDVAAALGA